MLRCVYKLCQEGKKTPLLEAAWWDGAAPGGPRAPKSLIQEANLGNLCKLLSVRSLKTKQKTSPPQSLFRTFRKDVLQEKSLILGDSVSAYRCKERAVILTSRGDRALCRRILF